MLMEAIWKFWNMENCFKSRSKCVQKTKRQHINLMAVNCWKRRVIQTANKSHNTDSPLLEFAVAKKQKTEKSYREKSEKKKNLFIAFSSLLRL